MTATETLTQTVTEVQLPRLYNVKFYNDDVTTMEFVIYVLVEIFDKEVDEAVEITRAVHEHGSSIVALYTREIAEQKTEETIHYARSNGFPLHVTFQVD